MNIFSALNISKAFQNRKLLDKTSFYLEDGEKVGVIGVNGTGKSTLLKIIAGIEEVDSGEIVKAKGIVIRFLSQNPEFKDEMTVLEAVIYGNKNKENEWTVEADAKSMLNKLGVEDFSQPCGQLSGGQKKRLALVSALLAPADILVLDEPTNHLDTTMSDWLEGQLKAYKGSIVMVTHDRYFLDSIANRIIEIDKGTIYNYDADYAGFLELKASREDISIAADRKRKSILRTELEWVMRGARARSTKQKARLERYEEMKKTENFQEDSKVELGSVSQRLGKSTIELKNISKSYDDKTIIKDFSYTFLHQDRIGILGANGAGKSTLLKIIQGEVQADSGEVLIGQTVKIGYYAQEIGEDEMKAGQRVIDYIKDVAEYIETEDGTVTAAKLLETFLFNGEMQYSDLTKLSGGERRRLYLCKILMASPNVLILDEPTNDLDITTLTVLENFLDDFKGIVIVVSHDRYFIDRVVRRIFAFDEYNNLYQYEGGYTDYKHKLVGDLAQNKNEINSINKNTTNSHSKDSENTSTANDNSSNKKWNSDRVKKLKFTYQEQKEYDIIEEEIESIESKLEQLEEDMTKFSTNFTKLREIIGAKEEMEALLEEKMERWEYLENLDRKIKEQG